uniref:Putative cuticular protein 17 from low complexity family n=1 Tax=Triatoma infestans TaxID=30076 RepID=A0A023F6S5_TRIIF
MYKIAVVVPLFFAAVSAGFLGGHGGVAVAPAVAAAPFAVAHAPAVAVAHAPAVAVAAPAATSYANTYRVVHGSVPVVRTVAAAPVVAHAAPVAVATHAAFAAPAFATVGHGYHG